MALECTVRTPQDAGMGLPFELPGCQRAPAEIDPRALWFSRLFFLRRPLAEEDAALIAAVAWMRRRWLLLLAAYLFVFIPLLVLPGLLRDRSPEYQSIAIVLPHLMLYLLAMTAAYSWLGFRVNLATYKDLLPGVRRDRMRRVSVATLVGITLAGAVVGFFAGSFLDIAGDAAAQWMRDTFTPGVLTVLFVLATVLVPELVAQLRLREHDLAERVRRTEAASEQLARQTVESELRLLQAQVEPHFLYNTLANLRYLVSSKSGDALRMTDALIDYLRTSVPDMRANRVTLGREIDHATHYLELMQMRMGERLSFRVDLPAALREIELPPLMVLTLVENAIKHGIAPRVEGGNVQISVDALPDERIRIAVADTGAGSARPIEIIDVNEERQAMASDDAQAQARRSTRTGLASVRGRLALTYGETASITLRPNQPRGVVAEIVLPRQVAPAHGGGRVSILYAGTDAELQTIAGKLVAKLGQPDTRQ